MRKKKTKPLIIDPQRYYDSLIFEDSNPKQTYANDFINLLVEIALKPPYNKENQKKEKVS